MTDCLDPPEMCLSPGTPLRKGVMNSRRMVLQMDLVGQTNVALGMRTVDRFAIRVVTQVLPVEVPSESVPIPEALLALLKRQSYLSSSNQPLRLDYVTVVA